MYQSLFIVWLVAHLMAVNLAAAGPLACLILEWLARRRGSSVADLVARRLARDALWAFAVGAALGGAFLAVMWQRENDPFVAAMLRFTPAKLWFAAAELAFYAACQAGYVWLWRRPWRATRLGRSTHRLLPILAATNLLYHFPPMMVAIGEIAAGKLPAPDVIDAAAYRTLAFSPQVLSRSIHHILAAIALAGLYAAVLGWRTAQRNAADDAAVREANWAAACSGRIALVATLLQIPVGIWVLLSLPDNRSLMGDDLPATAIFVVAVLAALGLMQHLAAIALGEVTRNSIATAAKLYLFVVAAMTTALVLSRGG